MAVGRGGRTLRRAADRRERRRAAVAPRSPRRGVVRRRAGRGAGSRAADWAWGNQIRQPEAGADSPPPLPLISSHAEKKEKTVRAPTRPPNRSGERAGGARRRATRRTS